MSGQQALDPDRDKLSASCFDFLLIELVPLAYRIAADMHTKEAALIRQSEHLSLSSNMTNPTTTLNRKPRTADRSSDSQNGTDRGTGMGSLAETRTSIGGVLGTEGTMDDGGEGDEDERREAVFWRLDALGYRVGQGLVERYVRVRKEEKKNHDVKREPRETPMSLDTIPNF